jgi:hypothetical protein
MLRQFAGAWLVFLLGLGAHQYFARQHHVAGLALGIMAVVAGAPGLLKPGTIRWLYVALTVLTFPLGWLVSQLALAVMFYGILTPVALFFRLRKRDLLQRRPPPECATHWQPKGPPPEARRYLRQY